MYELPAEMYEMEAACRSGQVVERKQPGRLEIVTSEIQVGPEYVDAPGVVEVGL